MSLKHSCIRVYRKWLILSSWKLCHWINTVQWTTSNFIKASTKKQAMCVSMLWLSYVWNTDYQFNWWGQWFCKKGPYKVYWLYSITKSPSDGLWNMITSSLGSPNKSVESPPMPCDWPAGCGGDFTSGAGGQAWAIMAPGGTGWLPSWPGSLSGSKRDRQLPSDSTCWGWLGTFRSGVFGGDWGYGSAKKAKELSHKYDVLSFGEYPSKPESI